MSESKKNALTNKHEDTEVKDSKTDSVDAGTLSLRFNGHFPGGSGLAGTRMYPFWILLELRPG